MTPNGSPEESTMSAKSADLSPECGSGFATGHLKCREGWCECNCHDPALAAAFAAVTTPTAKRAR